MKKILFFLITLVFLFKSGIILAANDLSFTCTSSACTKSSSLPLFSESNIYPGFSVSAKTTVNNNRQSNCQLNFKLKSQKTPDFLSPALIVSAVGDTTVWYAGILSDLFDNQNHPLDNISAGTTKVFLWTISFNQNAGNGYQNLSTIFDLNLNFECLDEITPTATPTSTSGGSVQGVTTSTNTNTCNDSTPGGAPTLLSLIPGNNNLTLNWSEGISPLSYYLIAYGTSPGVYQYGNPNIGGPGTTSYTVGSLSPGQTYYFVVRAGNGCSPGPFSHELSGRPLAGGVVIPPGQIPPGFQPGVLGAQTTLTPTPAVETGNLLGVQTSPPTTCCFWIFSLIALIANIKILYSYRRRHFIKAVLGAVVISLTGYLLDKYLSPRFCQNFLQQVPLIKNIFFNNCHLVWLWSLLSFLIPYFLTIFS